MEKYYLLKDALRISDTHLCGPGSLVTWLKEDEQRPKLRDEIIGLRLQ